MLKNTVPWEDIDQQLIDTNQLNLMMLRDYWLLPMEPQKTSGVCCNCERTIRIYSMGLCQTCYLAGKSLRGQRLLDTLLRKRVELSIVAGDDDDDFERPKVVAKVELPPPEPEEDEAEVQIPEKLPPAKEVVQKNMVNESESKVAAVVPTIKRSMVVEFGDAEIEFRVGDNTVDIKVEDGGDMVFLARNLDPGFLVHLAQWANPTGGK